jgi:1-phosphofructokinase
MSGGALDSIVGPSVTVFGPDPLLGVLVQTWSGDDDLQIEAGGQGVWLATIAHELGTAPILCGLLGGETGRLVRCLAEAVPIELRCVDTAGSSGSYLVDEREDQRRVLVGAHRPAPTRAELDDLVALTTAAALDSGMLVMCNPFPPSGFPLEVYDSVAANARAAGVDILVDLSSPRLDHVLAHHPDLVKLNDWELAEYIRGPVDGERAVTAARHLQEAGAWNVVVTRAGAPILVVPGRGAPYEIGPPSFVAGFREGCGDAMMGAVAAAWARGSSLRDALILGAAAGSVSFLRHGMADGRREAIEAIVPHIAVTPLTSAHAVA